LLRTLVLVAGQERVTGKRELSAVMQEVEAIISRRDEGDLEENPESGVGNDAAPAPAKAEGCFLCKTQRKIRRKLVLALFKLAGLMAEGL
jgi:hypothetical protein